MATKGRPARGQLRETIEMGLRGTREEAEIIQRGAELEAARMRIPLSRNNFCLRASLAQAKIEIDQAERRQALAS